MLPIKAIKLRAGFLLLLFTLMFISSNSFITEIYASESLEESFKATPLPFWEIDNENVIIQYETNTQDICFYQKPFLEDFSSVDNWISLNDLVTEENGIATFTTSDDYIWDRYDNNFPDGSSNWQTAYFECEYRVNVTSGFKVLIVMNTVDNYGGNAVFNFYLFNPPSSTEWTSFKIQIIDLLDYDNVECLSILLRSSVSNAKVEMRYISVIGRGYQEDMSVISDWSYDSSANLAPADYSFTTNGDIGDLYFLPDEHADEWVMYKTPMNYLITEFTRMETKIRSTNSHIITSTRILGIGLDVEMSTTTETSWQVQNPDIAQHAGKVINWLRVKIDDTPNTLPAFDGSGFFDYINIWESGGSLNVSIPIEQFKNHKLEFMLDTDDLRDTTKLEFGIFQNYDSMNYDFSLENQIFEQRDFSFNYSGYNYLRFKLDLKYSTNLFKITCYDENNSKLFSNIIYEYVRKTANQFKISSSNFTKWCHMYYFTGNINYETIWQETIVNEDTNIDYSMLASSALGNDMLNDHEIIYNRFVSNFQFLRTNMFEYTYFSANLAPELGIMLDIQFFYPDGTEFYRINGKLYRTYNELVFFMKVYETIDSIESEIFSSACGSDLGTTEIEGNIQFAIWRTQDNHLASFYNSDADNFPDISEISRFLSDNTLNNFQANISITYFSEDILLGYRNFVIELEGFELGYSGLDGVAEPHFSTTWWEYIPILGPIITAFMLVASLIVSAIETGLLPFGTILDAVGNAIINGINSAIGDVAGSVWTLFEATLDALGVSIDAIASDVWGFFEILLDSIAGVIDDIYAIINDTYTSIVNLSNNLIASIGTGITNVLVPAIVAGMTSISDAMFALWEYELNLVGNALGWGDIGTFLFDFTDTVVLVVPSWLAFLIGTMSFLVSILVWVNLMWVKYGAMFITMGTLFVALDFTSALLTMNDEVIAECVGKYLGVLEKIVTFMYNIISTLLNAIWGILPF